VNDSIPISLPENANGILARFTRRFDDHSVIRVEDLRIGADSGITVLFGASGSGKTTVLRCLAGLERPDRGSISFNGVAWSDAEKQLFLPPRLRRTGFVPQEYALFPHLSVGENIAYGIHELPSKERRIRVQEMLEWLGLDGLEERLPRELSGGQQQRVALARAVARPPQLLLLDEPFAALDSPTRLRLRGELRRLIRQLGVPVILVTHDRLEAMALGDRLVVMDCGEIIQHGPVLDVFNRPANLAAAGIVGIETVRPGKIVCRRDGLAYLAIGEAVLTAVDRDLPAECQDVCICIRAEDVILSQDEQAHSSPRNRLRAVVRSIMPEGSMVRIELDCGFPLMALLTKQGYEEMALNENDTTFALIKAPQIHLIARAE
jgi:molybdate transport system ATP-binding protein